MTQRGCVIEKSIDENTEMFHHWGSPPVCEQPSRGADSFLGLVRSVYSPDFVNYLYFLILLSLPLPCTRDYFRAAGRINFRGSVSPA